ncbi:MAG: hypothetical protein ACF8TS_21685 [Maioricimonas sp. JB049]
MESFSTRLILLLWLTGSGTLALRADDDDRAPSTLPAPGHVQLHRGNPDSAATPPTPLDPVETAYDPLHSEYAPQIVLPSLEE